MIHSALIYAIVFVITVFMGYIYQHKILSASPIVSNEKVDILFKQIIGFIIISCSIVFITSVRLGVGSDYNISLNTYNDAKSWGLKNIVDMGIINYNNHVGSLYLLLNYFSSLVIDDVHFSLFVCNMLILLMLYISLNSFKSDISIPFSLYIFCSILFSPMCNIIRQIMATMIIMAGYKFLVNKKFFRYFLCVFIASLFHSSALFCLVFFAFNVLSIIKSEKKKNVIRIVYYIIVLLSPLIIYFLLNIIKDIPISLVQRYFKDYTLEYYNRIGSIIIRLGAIVPMFIYRKKIYDTIYETLFNVMLLDIAMTGISFFTKYGFRFVYYTLPAQVILVSHIFKTLSPEDKKTKYIKAYYILYYACLFIYQVILKGNDGINNYQWILSTIGG